MSQLSKMLVSSSLLSTLSVLAACGPETRSRNYQTEALEALESKSTRSGACRINTGFWGIRLASKTIGIGLEKPIYIDGNYKMSQRILSGAGQLELFITHEGKGLVQQRLNELGGDLTWDTLGMKGLEVEHRSVLFVEGQGLKAHGVGIYQAFWTAPSGVTLGISLQAPNRYAESAQKGFNELLDSFCWASLAEDPALKRSLGGIWQEVDTDGAKTGVKAVFSPEEVEFVAADGFVQSSSFDTKGGRLNLYDEGFFSTSYGVSFSSAGIFLKRTGEVFSFVR